MEKTTKLEEPKSNEKFEKSKIAESYQDEIDKLEVSKDISSNMNTAKRFMQKVITKEDELVENDVLRLLEKVIQHFGFVDEASDIIIDFATDAFQTYSKKQSEKKHKEEILKKAKTNMNIDKIFPAIDFKEKYGMIYAVKGYDENGEQQTYIATASKKIYEIQIAKTFGIITTHEENIDTKFSLINFVEYDEGKTVQANEIFLEIKKLFEKYVVVSKEFLNVLATYVMMTYIYVLFQVIPYLWLNGEKGTGKSTIMKLMNKLCFNALYGSNLNPANIFRQIDNDGSTIILDEFEKMYRRRKARYYKNPKSRV